MRFDLLMRSAVREQIGEAADKMKAWESQPRISEDEEERLRENLTFFEHTTKREGLVIGGVDGSGDFPAVSYADSFVYFAVAQGTIYQSDAVSGLREIGPTPDPVHRVVWMPEEETVRSAELDKAFADLAGLPIAEVIQRSDYRELKSRASRQGNSTELLISELFRPHASDAGNLAIQLRSLAELGAALRLMGLEPRPDYVLVDTTMSLPSVHLPAGSLFHEHLKRLCCVEARTRGIGFLALSKSHGLPSVEQLEEIARDKGQLERGRAAEHWYLRIPTKAVDGWELGLAEGVRVPPPGAVSYLVRFHKTTPVLRLDMDREYWLQRVKGTTPEETRARESRIFGDLDYASHDQRSYGYPYPIKAGHDRASLTKAERSALRKLIVDEAVKAGMKRSLFRSAAQATGHE